MSELFRAERDTIAGLGLLASTYVRFDPPLRRGASLTHGEGFNVHCLVVDNVDGEPLALEQNRIYADHNPLQHAEQLGVRSAIARLHAKRPRPNDLSVEQYYKELLFMGQGTEPDDYLNRGCTLYNTFDPCGMCAVTLLVCYMKRIAYLFDDVKFAGVYEHMRTYFKGRQSVKEPLYLVVPNGDGPLVAGSRLIAELRERVKKLEEEGTQLVMTLDACRDELARATELLASVREDALRTEGQDRARNLRTLVGVKRMCNLA